MDRGKRLDIQALRAIAVVAVVIYHIWPNRLIGGFMGVDIFFVLSGFLMTSTIMRDAQVVVTSKDRVKSTIPFLVNFYARRIKRLIPAATVTLLSTLGMVYITGNLHLIQETSKQIVASALFFQNWFLANNSVDYLADKNPTAVQHFWSLSLEEQFYLVWPITLLVLLLVTANFYIVYKRERLSSLAIMPVLAMVGLFFTYGYYLTQTEPSLAYFVTPARVWQLLIGGAIAFLPTLKSYDLRLLLPWLGTVMIGYALYRWDGAGFPGWHAMVPTLGTALIIYAGGMASESKWSFENVLRFKPIQWLGDISYSLYLWHWPLIILLPVLFFVDIDTHPQSFLIKIGILVLSIVMAYLSYRYVEQSTRYVKLNNRYIYGIFAVCISLTASLGYLTSTRVEATLENSVSEARALVFDDSNKCVGAKSVFNDCEKSFGFIEDRFAQVASEDSYDFILTTSSSCYSYGARYRSGSQYKEYCIVGDKDSKKEITVWGDSHAQHWVNPVDKIGLENGIKINVIGTSYCTLQEEYKKYQENCDARFNSIKNSGVLDRSEAIIFSVWHRDDINEKGNVLSTSLEKLMSLTNNREIFLLEDIPRAGKSGGPDCVILRESCRYQVDDATRSINETSLFLAEEGLVEKDDIISVEDMFCDEEYCFSNIGGLPVYRDNSTSLNNHMTSSFAYSTWPMLEQKFKDAGVIK